MGRAMLSTSSLGWEVLIELHVQERCYWADKCSSKTIPKGLISKLYDLSIGDDN